ncbi:thioesterase domain-containing protein, partial [Pseudoalteromonas luteoviolacea]
MKAVQATGPYHLIGYSFGGVIAFEMAKQLEN